MPKQNVKMHNKKLEIIYLKKNINKTKKNLIHSQSYWKTYNTSEKQAQFEQSIKLICLGTQITENDRLEKGIIMQIMIEIFHKVIIIPVLSKMLK